MAAISTNLLTFLFCLTIVCSIVALFFGFSHIKNAEHRNTSYYQCCHVELQDALNDPGRLGEYEIYCQLSDLEKYGAKLLFNLYIPRSRFDNSEDNFYTDEATEIDALMLFRSGIYVFESKNLTGRIYGSANAQNWTRYPYNSDEKDVFYNPILQNNAHIRHLKQLIPITAPYHSLIVFPEKCTLHTPKDFGYTHIVTHLDLHDLIGTLDSENPDALSPEQITFLYDKLFPYTQVTEQEKQKHIAQVNSFR